MFLSVKLIGEDVADNAFFVDDVDHSTRQYAHGRRDAIRFTQSPLLIAQKQERQVVMWSYHFSPGNSSAFFSSRFSYLPSSTLREGYIICVDLERRNEPLFDYLSLSFESQKRLFV